MVAEAYGGVYAHTHLVCTLLAHQAAVLSFNPIIIAHDSCPRVHQAAAEEPFQALEGGRVQIAVDINIQRSSHPSLSRERRCERLVEEAPDELYTSITAANDRSAVTGGILFWKPHNTARHYSAVGYRVSDAD